MFYDGDSKLASVGRDNRLIIWDLDVKGWNDKAGELAGRQLTPEERNKYLLGEDAEEADNLD